MGIFSPTTAQQLATIRANQTMHIMPDLKTILANQVKIMALADDFNKVVSDVQASIATAITLIESLHSTSSGGGGSVTDAEVEAAMANLTASSTALGGAVPKP